MNGKKILATIKKVAFCVFAILLIGGTIYSFVDSFVRYRFFGTTKIIINIVVMWISMAIATVIVLVGEKKGIFQRQKGLLGDSPETDMSMPNLIGRLLLLVALSIGVGGIAAIFIFMLSIGI